MPHYTPLQARIVAEHRRCADEISRLLWEWKAGFKPDQPRVPRGQTDGGQWTNSELSHVRRFDPDQDDPPIEPVYPVETALLWLTAGEVATLFRAWRASRAVITPNRKLADAIEHLESYLGGKGHFTRSRKGNIVLQRGDKKIRFDIHDSGGDKPHFHIERRTSHGNWRDAGRSHRYYFKDTPP